MKNMKRIATAALSAAMLAGMAGTGLLADVSSVASAASYQTVHSVTSSAEWNSRMTKEQNKYPETKNGKQCYWNRKWNIITGKNGDQNTYSTTACEHNSQGYCTDCNTLKMTAENGYYFSVGYHLYTNYDAAHGSSTTYSQCIGFSCKVAMDMWKTDTFIQYDINGGKIQYGDKTSEDYVPKVGDNLRFTAGGYEHSIFITYVNGDDIRFVQCNADNKCGIDWNANTYRGTGVTQRYLRSHAKYVERPAIAGDLNLNGKIDNGDATIFEETVMYNGVTRGSLTEGRDTIVGAPMAAYDVNADGYVNTSDLNQIKYGSNHPDYMKIISYHDVVSCRWQTINHIYGFRFSDGCYYVKNNMGGASWIGAVDTEVTSLTVSSRVYSPEAKCWYTVTEIGYDSRGKQSGGRTCTKGCKIKNFRIPDTIKKIHSYAFEEGQLENFQFAGSNPQLENIDAYAFYNCKKLTALNLSNCTKLTNVGDYAFNGCNKLTNVTFPTTTSSSVSAQMNMKYGTQYGMFNDSSIRTTPTTLIFMNNKSATRTVILTDNDIAMWRNRKLGVCVSGTVKIKDTRGNVLRSVTNSQLIQVYPN